MRVVDRDGIVAAHDSPGLHWILGLLVAGDGAAVPVSLLWTHGRDPVEATAARLREALGAPRPPTARNAR